MVDEKILPEPSTWRQQFEQELTGNILPFWSTYVVDKVQGGFYGALTNDRQIHDEVPRAAILCARILWSFSAAYRFLGEKEYLSTARRAYDSLAGTFWDTDCGGFYWSVDSLGRPVSDRKQSYAQAFGIYGLAEYYRATQDPESLEMAKSIFQLLEKHVREPVHGGYLESRSRSWDSLADMRLSEADLNYRKSMNSMLHILEAYTNLLQVWDDPLLRRQHRALLDLFEQKIYSGPAGHFKLFFDDAWHSLLERVSYGHDIEASWLLLQAAEVQADPDLVEKWRARAVEIAAAVSREGMEADGSLTSESGPGKMRDTSKNWWVEAEAVVGFYNAYQVSGQARFARAADQAWRYIQDHFVDRTYGDWYKQLKPDGAPDPERFKAGPWDCPYHSSRMCLEMMARLDK